MERCFIRSLKTPYAPGATAQWTEYFYDALGRVTKVKGPSGQETNHQYVANTVKSIDASGKWKTLTLDAFGQVVKVTEPNPAGGTFDTTFRYDTLDRVTEIRRYPVNGGAEDAAQRTNFYYDGLGNGKGRLNRVVYGSGVSERYEYTPAGLKRFKAMLWGNGLVGMSASAVYDNEGRRTSMTYPVHYTDHGGGVFAANPARVMNYGFDSAGRLNAVTDTQGFSYLTAVQYNAAGQITAANRLIPHAQNMTGNESFQYNAAGQLVRQSMWEAGALAVDVEYRFAAVNDGRLWQRKDWVTGEEITYSYDPLGRLSAAATTSSAWGLSWNYDGFGNRLQQTVTKGSAPSHSVAVNGLTNQIIGQSHDLNGNLGQASSSDIENRPNNYWYSAANQRLLSKTTTPVLWFHGLDEELLGQFELRSDNGDPAKQYPVLKDGTERIYTRGRLLMMGWQSVSTDRLGSVVRHGTANLRYYPYGEEMGGATTQNRAKFATYTRDPDGSDYAWSRQYATISGRFTTPDPYRASGGAADPASWNRYTYVQNDPVNYYDRPGLLMQNPGYCPPDKTYRECVDDGIFSEPSGGGGGIDIGVGGGGNSFRRATEEEKSRHRAAWLTRLAAVVAAGQSEEQENRAYPAYLKVVGDSYSCWGKAVQRSISYQLMGSDGQPIGTGVITEHLFPTDDTEPVITRPSINSSSGEANGMFDDEHSVQYGRDRTFIQAFTVRGSMPGLAGFTDIPLYIDGSAFGWGPPKGFLEVKRTFDYVEINGVMGTVKKCR